MAWNKRMRITAALFFAHTLKCSLKTPISLPIMTTINTVPIQGRQESRLKKVVMSVQQLSDTELEELFRMIQQKQCPYTCNNHGVFLNLSWISEETLFEIEQFIAYCDQARSELERYENIQMDWNKVLERELPTPDASPAKPAKKSTSAISFSSKSGQYHPIISTPETSTDPAGEEHRKVRSNTGVRFYLLKKRFQRLAVPGAEWDDILQNDEYPTSDQPI